MSQQNLHNHKLRVNTLIRSEFNSIGMRSHRLNFCSQYSKVEHGEHIYF